MQCQHLPCRPWVEPIKYIRVLYSPLPAAPARCPISSRGSMSPVRSIIATPLSLVCFWAALAVVLPARAQEPPSADATLQAAESFPPPAHLAVVEGSVTVEREGVSEPATANA